MRIGALGRRIADAYTHSWSRHKRIGSEQDYRRLQQAETNEYILVRATSLLGSPSLHYGISFLGFHIACMYDTCMATERCL